MMPSMMFDMAAYILFWTVLATLLSLLLVGVCIWLVANLLKKQRTSAMQYTQQPQDAYQDYQQGYQPYPLPQYEQPQAQYPQIVSSDR